jgi:hypothetical protein
MAADCFTAFCAVRLSLSGPDPLVRLVLLVASRLFSALGSRLSYPHIRSKARETARTATPKTGSMIPVKNSTKMIRNP